MQHESTTARPRAKRAKHPEGIEVRHKKHCAGHQGKRCSCEPTYSAVVVLGRENGKRQRQRSQPYRTEAEAVAWRNEARVAIKKQKLRAHLPITGCEAVDRFIEGAESGAVRNRSGDIYKPSAARGIAVHFRLRIVPDLGARKLADVKRADLQALVGRMQSDRKSPSTIRNTINAVRALYRWATQHDLVDGAANPTRDLSLPRVNGRRERFADPSEVDDLLGALPHSDRRLRVAALYAGLRRGELRALDWKDVDFEAEVIHVRRAWDDKAGLINPKSDAGVRDVPLSAYLRAELLRHKLAQGRGGLGLIFGRSSDSPFVATTAQNRADRAWKKAGQLRITLHECRHTYASLMIAAGVEAHELQRYMGHSSITMTVDRYGHLMPGVERDAAAKLDALMGRSRAAQ